MQSFIGAAEGVFRRPLPQSRWDTEAVNGVNGVLWRLTDCKWTVERSAPRVDPNRHCHLQEYEFIGNESQSKTMMNLELLWVVKAATRTRTGNERKPTQIIALSDLDISARSRKIGSKE